MKKVGVLLLFMVIFLYGDVLDDIVANKQIKIGVSNYMPPFSQYTSNGKFEGFEINFSKELVSKMFGDAVDITFVGIEQGERLEVIKSGKVDMVIAAYTRNDEREKYADFSMPYFSINLAVLTPKSSNIKDMSDLVGKKILAINETNSETYLKKSGKFNIIPCSDNKDCYNKLKSGEADAYMHNIVSVATIPILDPDYEVSIKSVGESFMDCVVVKKDSPKLISKINDAIISLSSQGYFRNTYEQTFKPYYKGSLEAKYFVLDDLYKMFI